MEAARPLFSILIVSLNPGRTLAATLSSIREQRFSDYEVVIKDGGSTDGSIEGMEKQPKGPPSCSSRLRDF